MTEIKEKIIKSNPKGTKSCGNCGKGSDISSIKIPEFSKMLKRK